MQTGSVMLIDRDGHEIAVVYFRQELIQHTILHRKYVVYQINVMNLY